MKKLAFLLAIAAMFAFAACSDENAEQSVTTTASTSAQDPSDSSVITTTLIVGGMTCGSCSSAIESELSELDGVISVSVDLSSGRVTVTHEPELSVDEIRETIILEGFTVE
jgi:Cu+-exporting ATPase